METYYLREFAALAELKSFSRVSEALNTSASSASRHIQALENDLGVQLVDRNPQGISLTEYGELALPYVQQIIQAEQQCIRHINDRKNEKRHRLAIGTAGDYGIADVVSRFYLKNQDTQINIHEYSPDTIIDMLNTGICEIIFCDRKLIDEEKTVAIPYARFHYKVSVPRNSPLAEKEAITLYDLENERIILEDDGVYTRNQMKALFEEAGIQPHNIMYVGRGAHIFVTNGAGVSISLTGNPRRSRMHDIVDCPLRPDRSMEIAVCYLRSTQLSRGAKQFIDYLLQQWPKDRIEMERKD